MPPQRTVKPEQVKTLRDWVQRWPKVANLDFDADTREPTIYTVDSTRKRVGSIPWRREVDTLTVLTQPERYTEQMRLAAKGRYDRIVEQKGQLQAAADEQLRIAERNLLDAWRAYEQAPAASRSALRRDVLAAERSFNEMEAALAKQLYRERKVREFDGDMVGTYIPLVPTGRRGIPMSAVLQGEAAAAGGAGSASSE
jgi:hypothetical protein